MKRYRVAREYRNADGVLTGCNSIGLDGKLYVRKEDAESFCKKLNECSIKGEKFVVIDTN